MSIWILLFCVKHSFTMPLQGTNSKAYLDQVSCILLNTICFFKLHLSVKSYHFDFWWLNFFQKPQIWQWAGWINVLIIVADKNERQKLFEILLMSFYVDKFFFRKNVWFSSTQLPNMLRAFHFRGRLKFCWRYGRQMPSRALNTHICLRTELSNTKHHGQEVKLCSNLFMNRSEDKNLLE